MNKTGDFIGGETAEEWLSEHGESLKRYALMFVNDAMLAEDLVQESLLAAYQKRDTFEGRSSVRSWLRTILKNKVIDYLRSSKNVKTSNLEAERVRFERNSPLNNPNVRNWVVTWSRGPERTVERKHHMEILQKCFTGLSEKERSVVVARVNGREAVLDLCNKLEVSEGQFAVILYRTRCKLKHCIESRLEAL